MAKVKKGKQKQDAQPPTQPPAQLPTQLPAQPPAIVTKEPDKPPKVPTKEVVDDTGLTEMPGGILDDGWPTPAKPNQDPWTNNAPPADSWGNANHGQAMKAATTNPAKEKQGAINKAATGRDTGGWGQENSGWGTGGNDDWGAGGNDGWGAGGKDGWGTGGKDGWGTGGKDGWGTGGKDGWGHGGAKNTWGNNDYDEEEWDEEEEEEEEEEEDYGWDAPSNPNAWGIRTPSATQQTGWRGWSEEAKGLSKVTAPAPAGNGRANRTVLSSQQQSQILSSLLSQPQTQNGYVAHAQQQQNQRQRQAANPYPQQPTSHLLGGNIFPSLASTKQSNLLGGNLFSSLTSTKQSQAQPQKQPSKEEKRSKKERERSQQKTLGKHQRSQSENFDSLGWGTQASDSYGWGTIPEEDEEEEYDDRRVHFSPRSASLNAWGVHPSKPAAPSIWGSEPSRTSAISATPKLPVSEKPIDTFYTMPSKTLAHAYNGTATTPLNTGIPRNKMNEYTNVQFNESKGAAFAHVQQALFGRARKAKDRIHWLFPSDKDERVESLLTWIQSVSYSLGSYGLHRFLQSRERGALLTNADFRLPGSPGEPAFDWLTFDQLRETRDKILQESVAFYDPTKEVVVFVFLPSKSGNSVAMWRRRINVPNNMRLMLQGEISLALTGLRREKDYVVYVDEYPAKPAGARRASVPPYPDYSAYPIMVDEEGGRPAEKKKKKRKWWQFFKITCLAAMDPSSSPMQAPASLQPAISEPPSEPPARRSYPATTHFAVLAAVILPITLMPYLICRRQVSALQRRVNELEGVTKTFHKDLNAAVLANGSWKDEHRRMRTLLHQMMNETEEVKTYVQQRDAAYRVSEETTQSELQRLLEEARIARVQGDALRALGLSIADIAAFMHEVELYMPLELGDKSRVGQLRSLALMLQKLPKHDQSGK